MDRKLQRHRADSLRQHGFLVLKTDATIILLNWLKDIINLLSQLRWFYYIYYAMIIIERKVKVNANQQSSLLVDTVPQCQKSNVNNSLHHTASQWPFTYLFNKKLIYTVFTLFIILYFIGMVSVYNCGLTVVLLMKHLIWFDNRPHCS